ncbi:unnamed protein product, partial [Linum tenue]
RIRSSVVAVLSPVPAHIEQQRQCSCSRSLGEDWESRSFKIRESAEMEDGNGSDLEREEGDSVGELLRDRFRLSAISIVEAQAKKNEIEISEPITAYISDLAFKFTEQLGKDVELFAQHGGRKCVNMEDVILSSKSCVLSSLRLVFPWFRALLMYLG